MFGSIFGHNNMLLPLLVVQLLLIVLPVTGQDPDKWVWPDSSDGERRAAPRYEVFESSADFSYGKPSRPTFGVQGGVAGISNRPNRPGQGFYNPQRPLGIYGQGHLRPPRPGGHYGQVGNFGINPVGPDGVLTGPSGGKGRPYKYFDTCKCTERFNCNSHGVAYGHCDVGKQYCCYGRSGPAPSKPIHSASNGVLIGPGGPFDKPDTGNGILVGPGGPTGIIGRPSAANGQGNHPSNGVLIGPGGPFDGPYNNIGSLYGRSADKDE